MKANFAALAPSRIVPLAGPSGIETRVAPELHPSEAPWYDVMDR